VRFGFSVRELKQRLRLIRDSRLIESSELFDRAWYLEKNPDIVQAGFDPVQHYLIHGAFEGRDPSPNFSSRWYLDAHEDVRNAGWNPLVHYLKYGRNEDRRPTPPLFQLLRMYDYSRETDRLVLEEAPERIYLRAPHVVGKFTGALNEGEASCPRPYVSVIEDALIFGGETIVVAEGNLILNDELVDFPGPEFGNKSPRVRRLEAPEGTAHLTENAAPRLHVREGVLLSCGHDANYFHWLVECLPKLLWINSLPEFQEAPLLIPAGLHKNLMAALERVNVNHRDVVYLEPGTACRVERLIYPSALSRVVDRYEGAPVFNVDIVLSHRWLARLAQRLTSSVHRQGRPWRKIYLSRRKGYRLLANWEEMELKLLEQGFEIVELEGASLDFQIELFSQAAVIVSPTGAALTNLLFCRPGTKVIIFMSNHEVTNLYFWSNLGAVRHLDVTTIIGDRTFKVTNYYSVHDDYVVDPGIVLEELKKLDQPQTPGQKSQGILMQAAKTQELRQATKIFVVGPPRSGTTLIYSMIADEFFLPECTFVSNLMKEFHQVYRFSDKERFDYYAHNLSNLAEIFKKPVYDFLYAASSKVGGEAANRYVYKDPMLTLYLEYFPLFFEDSYKVVFCLRDPRDVVASLWNVLKKQERDQDADDLFEQAVQTSFMFYQVIHQIDNTPGSFDRNKLTFIKYEDIVAGNGQAIQELQQFLGFSIQPQGAHEHVKGKLNESSPFYSENYAKPVSAAQVGRYQNTLRPEQIARVEYVFSFYMKPLGYG
jgi:hypothetical protein